MRHLPTTLMAVIAASAFGCTSDLRAPSNYLVGDDAAGSSSGGAMLTVECGTPPLTAVGAAFSHATTARGGDADYTYVFEDEAVAPAGLSIDPSTGIISGAPEAAGEFEFAIVVTDGANGAGTALCSLSINPRLTVQLEVEAPGCLSGSQSLLDLVRDGTGDGTPIVCDAPGGRGNGRVPEGNSISAEGCEIAGTFADPHYGIYVFMVRGTQSGAEVWVPYCVTNDDLGSYYNISVAHSGGDGTLEPLIGFFSPDANYSVGMPGDPQFEIEDGSNCGNCAFGFNYSVTASNFNGNDVEDLVTDDEQLSNDAGDPIGMQHGLATLAGSEIGEDFRDRAWVMSMELDYCLANTLAECTGAQFAANTNGRYHFSVLMFPEGT